MTAYRRQASYAAETSSRATSENGEADVLIIKDLRRPGHRSVTNDIERILLELKHEFGGKLPGCVIYRDSEGTYDGIRHDDGTFKDFYPIRTKNRDEAIDKALAETSQQRKGNRR
jgi:hypothetical protein